MYASPECVGSPFELNAGEKFECKGIDATFQHPRRNNFEQDSFRNFGRTGYIDQQANEFRKSRYFIPIEEREDTQFSGINRNMFANHATANVKHFEDRTKTTLRQTRQSRRNGNLSQVNRERGAYSYQQKYTHAKPTHKETAKLINYVGIAATMDHGATRDRQAECNATHRGAKEDALIGYTPGPGKTIFAQGTCDTNVTIKNQLGNEETVNPLIPSYPMSAIPTKLGKGMATAMTPGDRIDEFNSQLDLGIALPQLSGNPFALTPFSTIPGI